MKGRRNTLLVAALFTAMLTSTLAMLASPAEAWNALGCKWGSKTVNFYVGTNDSPTTGFENAAGDWNSATVANLVKVTSASDRNFKARNTNFGATGWSGLTHKEGDATVGPACNANGIWVNQDGMVSVNNYYNSASFANRRGVAVHEFGHMLGLAHNNNSLGSCPGGGQDYASIMYYSDARFNGNCAVFTPRTDDINGIAALY